MKRDPINRNTPRLPSRGNIPEEPTEHTFVLVAYRSKSSPDGRHTVAQSHSHIFTCLIADNICLPYRRG